jgi:RNA polymerase sigma-70 factor (ECF subfamily)
MHQIDKEIIRMAAVGDMDAFRQIYKIFSSTVYTIAFNITRNRQDAEEATQDVFVRVHRKLGDFQFGSSFGTWIYRIAVNTAINMYHNRKNHRQKVSSLDEIGDAAIPVSNITKDDLDRKSAESNVRGLLGHLSSEHRSCIVLRELEGLDYKEMADVLRIPLNTVRSRLKRARQALIAVGRSLERSI